jgi:riboflavin biosynthesis pyrimidine reductase
MGFAVEWPSGPWVRGIMVLTLNGSHIGATGNPRDLSGPADRTLFLQQRREADAIVIGAKTAATNDYGALKFDEQTRKNRRDRGQLESPEIFVATRANKLDSQTRLAIENPQTRTVKPDRAHLMALLLDLRQRRLFRLLCEGGPTLLTTLVENDLIDDLIVTYQMQLCPLSESTDFERPLMPRQLQLQAHQLVGNELLTHWVRHEPS